MPLGEFEVITRYFKSAFPTRDDVILGIGDDAALYQIPANRQLVIAIDTLVKNIHFPETTTAADIGYKALAVNLSDLAAMGATPAWMTLALTCPQADESWFAKLTQGLLTLAQRYQVSLIGGDTTRGELTITIQIAGLVPPQQALRRTGAQPGDEIYVTGTVGDAGLGLASVQKKIELPDFDKKIVESRLNRPTPRVDEGLALRGIASSAIDISDGLIADLGHILTANQVGANLFVEQLPLSPVLTTHLTPMQAWHLALTAGDDYELCFTVPPNRTPDLKHALSNHAAYTKIGLIEKTVGLRCWDNQGKLFIPTNEGYQHFR